MFFLTVRIWNWTPARTVKHTVKALTHVCDCWSENEHQAFGLIKNCKFHLFGYSQSILFLTVTIRRPKELAFNEHLSCAGHCYFFSLARKHHGSHFLGELSQKDGACPQSERTGESWDGSPRSRHPADCIDLWRWPVSSMGPLSWWRPVLRWRSRRVFALRAHSPKTQGTKGKVFFLPLFQTWLCLETRITR